MSLYVQTCSVHAINVTMEYITDITTATTLYHSCLHTQFGLGMPSRMQDLQSGTQESNFTHFSRSLKTYYFSLAVNIDASDLFNS